MPCSDSTSSIFIRLTDDERFTSFEFAKITCNSEINGGTGFSKYLAGKTPEEILEIPYLQAVSDLNATAEEAQFVLFMEWDALRAALAQYLGIQDPAIDTERCKINSIIQNEQGIEIALVVLPPKDLPKIISCGMAKK